MLSYLNITNIALIESAQIEFGDGLNILTGETGAGKSMIIDSVNFVFGEKSGARLIRAGEKEAKV
ncbi:MAG: AAA family ATPase, partial [Firmicutes bacterium]|nr:AAA family ATPase [Bacillota bacterium]